MNSTKVTLRIGIMVFVVAVSDTIAAAAQSPANPESSITRNFSVTTCI